LQHDNLSVRSAVVCSSICSFIRLIAVRSLVRLLICSFIRSFGPSVVVSSILVVVVQAFDQMIASQHHDGHAGFFEFLIQ
jgi:hypothetical protein